ncbi:hypothetical protein [Bacillus sp. JCM 19041]|uniref:hypothetical protein n=1 Tax=Bacillus sp. JCM 19041 TaxID=1460637 RepID=UPI0006D1138A
MLKSIPILPVKSMLSSIKFYEARLGFQLQEEVEDYALIQNEEAFLYLKKDDKEFRAKCVFYLENIDLFFRDRGYIDYWKTLGKLHLSSEGRLVFSMVDLDGNQLKLIESSTSKYLGN